ncbi:MAG: tetratricopeptide repeat protein, partial [Patescibacteria group bacterium]|nr:tetratricopeptide repeat protein [Patescibacteria group bacterium]
MTFFLSILIIGSLIGMGYIVVRKLPQLSIVEVESMKSEREAKIKRDILISRLKRFRAEGLIKMLKTMTPFFSPYGKRAKNWFLNLYQKILDLERKQKDVKPAKIGEPSSQIESSLEEADDLMKRDNLREAEKRYLEAIALDYKNLTSYEGLGELYIKKREYKEAKETFEHILKLDPERP